MEPRGSLLQSQGLSNNLYSKLNQSIHGIDSYLFKIYSDIVLFTPRPSLKAISCIFTCYLPVIPVLSESKFYSFCIEGKISVCFLPKCMSPTKSFISCYCSKKCCTFVIVEVMHFEYFEDLLYMNYHCQLIH